MTIQSTDRPDERPLAEGTVTHAGGIYGLPVIGRPAVAVRNFFDDMAPSEDDSSGVRAGKQVLRYGTVVAAGTAGAAAAAVIVL